MFFPESFRIMRQNFLGSVLWSRLEICSIQAFLEVSEMLFLICWLRVGILGSDGLADLIVSLVSVSRFISGERLLVKFLR